MTILRLPGRSTDADVAASDAPASEHDHPRLVSAGHILGVGLLCFALWLVLDARQLYNSAQSSPLGQRRSVAMSVLRPIARASSVLGLDRLVDGANDALGRAPNGRGVGAGSPPVARSHHHPHPSVTTVPPTGSSGGIPPLAAPSPAHPLTILEVGDSLGEDLGYGLANVIGSDPSVRLIQDARTSTGLADTAYYDWPASLESELREYHPGLVVVMLGGNDAQNFMADASDAAVFGTAYWREQYGARVDKMMTEATTAGAHVVWVGMPIMASTAFTAQMTELDDVFEVEAKAHPDVSYVSTWKLFENSTGAYSEYLPDSSGSLVEVREPDGVHIADPAGDDLVASSVLDDVEDEWHVALAPGVDERVNPDLHGR